MSALVALAGGVGAAVRFVVDGWLTGRWTTRVPLATALINVVGSALLGLLVGWCGDGDPLGLVPVLGVGLLGGFTTFSTASVEVARLLRPQPWRAVALAVAMVVAAVLACWSGLTVGSALA